MVIVIALGIMIWFSPYGDKNGYSEKIIVEKIKIEAPIQDVYNYLGNSDNATDWSVYVDHITPLNPKSVKDGELGAIRRCFKNSDESGMFWDEEIIINEKNKRRRLTIYNMQKFSVSGEGLLTEQIYTQSNGTCELVFTLFLEKGKSNWLAELKLYYAGYFVSKILKENLERIKKINEANVN